MEEAKAEIEPNIDTDDLKKMLEYETQIFRDIVEDDGLVVGAKGLNLELIILNIFKIYLNSINLVLVLNCTDAEENYYVKKLDSDHVHLTSNYTNTTERQNIYMSGGVHIVTTRILIVDMLKKRIPIDKITGIVILRAHKVIESCQEAFVLRLYRQNNKHGFIKAFSNSAQSFVSGFGHVERIMKTLFVKKLFIWPRFHKQVVENFKQFEPIVIELHVPLSKSMEKIQTCILDLMDLTIKELKRVNKTVELQEITVQNCLTRKFHKILQFQLDCIWHQLTAKSKQLVADLKTLRHLICTMLYTDPITFYSTLNNYRKTEYAQTATWLFLQPADLLFNHANSLVYGNGKELNPEFCPKWKTLEDLLQSEIPADIATLGINDAKVLILCQDRKTCFQLNNFLANGPNNYLFFMSLKNGIQFDSINKNFEGCQENLTQIALNSSKIKLSQRTGECSTSLKDGKLENCLDEQIEEFKNSYILTMSQAATTYDDANKSLVFEPFEELENLNLTKLMQPTILIQTFKCDDKFVSLEQLLQELKPHYIIMYHSNVTAIRQIELNAAHSKCFNQLKVYFLIHGETVEEQSYLTELRREKEAFEYLIESKSTMVIPEDQDGKSESCLNLQRGIKPNSKDTRQGGKVEQKEREYVIVDMREFRSELPALIHKRGIDIEPVTITVGDYIITNEICIERKSISDLIGSLNTGRLYKQCTQMCRYYTKPMLLIEFDQNKAFSWQSNYMISNDGNNFHIQQKLLLLTLHFPKLKLIWSPSPYASAQLIEELKEGKPQPDLQYAAAISCDENVDVVEAKYNTNVYDFVQKLPGITSKNIDAFFRRFDNLNQAITMSEEELKNILGNSSDAKQFYSALHLEHLNTNKQEVKQKRKLNKFKTSGNK